MTEGPRYLIYVHTDCDEAKGRPSLVPRWRVEAGSAVCSWCGQDGPLSDFERHEACIAFHEEHGL